ncbi:T9SS type A sorting domain-containing protein [candidate division KSB1 bacterium]|nr:T9SS type A sorting domain-containing protein [candidate division KSB1 bacterium]
MKNLIYKHFRYISFYFLAFLCLSPSHVKGQSQWQKDSGNPVLVPGQQDGVIAFSDPTLWFKDSKLQLWISGSGFLPGDTTAGIRTYYFTSDDGYSWQSAPQNPVFREGAPGTWDSGHTETPAVIYTAGEYRLYYSATPDAMADDGGQLRFGLATSPDGVTWVRNPANPILERGLPSSWEERQIESPTVLETDSLYYMWYNGLDAEWRIYVGLATSEDGLSWHKYPGNPVFSPAPHSDWDSVGVYAPQVRILGDRIVMLYTGIVFDAAGYDYNNARTGVAVSTDGINWSRACDRPVLAGTPGAWDAAGPFTLDWIDTGGQLLMVYMSDWKAGIATSPIDPAGVTAEKDKFPEAHILFPNYPNPFNSETIIGYRITSFSYVELIIFDVLGKEVKTLINKTQPPGEYHVHWNGTNDMGNEIPSGIYFYRLQTENFKQTKKVLLIR